MKVAGFVLAGGQSSRMGQNKARLPVDSRYLVEKIAETVLQVTDTVVLVGQPDLFTDLAIKCLPDMRSGFGPMAGLEAALMSAQSEPGDVLNVVVGCDMPGVRACWLEGLLKTAQDTGALCVAAKDAAGKTHPLCAVYQTACLPFIQQALDARRLRLTDLLASVNALELPIGEVIANVNTPGEWAAWQAHS